MNTNLKASVERSMKRLGDRWTALNILLLGVALFCLVSRTESTVFVLVALLLGGMSLYGYRIARETVQERIDYVTALATSEERFRLLSNAAPIGVFHTDAEDQCTYTNDRLQAITGLTFEETLGHGWMKACHPEDRSSVMQAWQRSDQLNCDFSPQSAVLSPHSGIMTWHA